MMLLVEYGERSTKRSAKQARADVTGTKPPAEARPRPAKSPFHERV